MDRTRGEGGAHRRSAAAHAEDAANPDGLPLEVFDGSARVGRGSLAVLQGFRGPFYGVNRAGANLARHLDPFWLRGMQVGLQECVRVHQGVLGDRFHGDLKKIDVPTLLLHGEDDQIVPIDAAGASSRQADQGPYAEGVPGRAARHHRHPQGPPQSGPARLRPGRGLNARLRALSLPTRPLPLKGSS